MESIQSESSSSYLTFYSDSRLLAYLTPRPVTPSHSILGLLPSTIALTSLPLEDFTSILLTARHLSSALRTATKAHRIAVATDGGSDISLIPLHGLSETWKPHLAPQTSPDLPTRFPTSRSGPRIPDAELDAVRERIASASVIPPEGAFDVSFHGPDDDTSLFARIVRGEEPQWRVWESATHVAFLTPWGNVTGFCVVVPRTHLESDVLGLGEEAYVGMMVAAWEVAKCLKKGLGVKRCGLFCEGFEVDYAHVKVVPVSEDHDEARDCAIGREVSDGEAEFCETYPGYLTTQPGPLTQDLERLPKQAADIRQILESSFGV